MESSESEPEPRGDDELNDCAYIRGSVDHATTLQPAVSRRLARPTVYTRLSAWLSLLYSVLDYSHVFYQDPMDGNWNGIDR